MEEEIRERCTEYGWGLEELDRRAELEYDAYVIDKVRFGGCDDKNFPKWSSLSETAKTWYRHRAVRDI